jgi:membrane protein YdbS with pleckstrin-like domain
MDFHNSKIDPDTLPDAGNPGWKPVEKSYLKVLRIQWLIFSLFLIALAFVMGMFIPFFQNQQGLILLGSGCLILIALYFYLQEKSFNSRAYVIRDHDILYRHGWVILVTEACPFNRIQHCSVDSGPLDRKFRLSTLTLFTAGSTGADLKIKGLPETLAASLREFIMKKIGAHEGTNL